jgi:hypothetical protein
MSEKVTATRWLDGLTAGLENPGELEELAREETAVLLSRCGDDEAAALRADLDAENAEITRRLAMVQSTASVSAVMRRLEIVRGALRAFEARR